MRSPPENHRELSDFECTHSTALPLVDVSIAGPAVVAGGIVTAGSVSESRNLAPGLTVLGIGILAAAAGIYGFDIADRCLDAQNEMIYRNELEIQRQLNAIHR